MAAAPELLETLEMERAGNEITEREITLLLCRAEPVSERFNERAMHRDGAERAR